MPVRRAIVSTDAAAIWANINGSDAAVRRVGFRRFFMVNLESVVEKPADTQTLI